LKLIYTIGYQRLTSRRLEKIVGDLDAILVDCRYRPFSQRPEFSGDRLAEQFGARYQQRGHELGGHGHTTVDGIDRLRLDAERATLLLLCMEEAPGDCHRHHAICGPHFPAAVHIFRDEQFTAKTLQDGSTPTMSRDCTARRQTCSADAPAALTVHPGGANPTFPTGPLILEFCRKNASRIKGRRGGNACSEDLPSFRVCVSA
jgi:hypothetical protein